MVAPQERIQSVITLTLEQPLIYVVTSRDIAAGYTNDPVIAFTREEDARSWANTRQQLEGRRNYDVMPIKISTGSDSLQRTSPALQPTVTGA
jgi:hypothetical protein